MKKYLILITLLTSAIFFFRVTTSHRMPPEYNYDSDFGRDLLMTEKITQGKLTLVGPQFSFSGLRLSPYHFYLFSPVLKVFDTYKAVVYANGLIFVAALVATFLLMYKTHGMMYSFLSVIWIATSSYIVLSGRSPGNAFTYLAFYLIYLTYFFTAKSRGTIMTFVMGVLGGVMVNYHPVNVLVILVPFFTKEIWVKDRFVKNIFLSLFQYFSGFALTFLPVIAFELKHEFILTKTFFGPKQADFITGSYLKTIGSISHMVSLNDISHTWIPITGLGLVALIIASHFERRKPEMRSWFMSVIGISAFFLVFGRTIAHYFFPTILFIQLMAIFFIKDIKSSRLILIVLIAINIFFFPVRFYSKDRNLNDVENNFNKAIKELPIPKTGVNTYLINKTHLSAPGYEYRYLLTKNGYLVDEESSYSTSKTLLVVSELGEKDLENTNTWEIKQFGEKKLIKKTKIEGTVYYLFEKSK